MLSHYLLILHSSDCSGFLVSWLGMPLDGIRLVDFLAITEQVGYFGHSVGS